MRTSTKLSALPLTTAIALGMTGQANAMDADARGSFAQIEQYLQQEHQVEVARAKYIMNEDDPAKVKVLCVKFTVNAQGDGYILLSDNMDDSQAHMEMIYGKMKKAHAYDPRNLGTIPQGVSPQSNLGHMLKNAAAEGDSVLMHGQSVKKMTDGSEAIVGSTTVMAHISDSHPEKRYTLGVLVTSTSDVTSLDKLIAIDLQLLGMPK